MQAFLLNFGDNTRVVNDSRNVAVSIGIGELKECDIHDVHYHMIRRGVARETLLVVPKDVNKSERLDAIMSLMRELNTEPYDDVLAKYNVLGNDDPETLKIRPTRDQMRRMLLDYARQEVAVALKLQSKVVIHEQGDETTRKEVPRPEPEKVVVPPQPEPKKIISPDAKDQAPRKAAKKKAAKTKTPSQSSKPKFKRERL